MNKFCLSKIRFLALIFFTFFLFSQLSSPVFAQTQKKYTFSTKVEARLGEFYLNLSGYISPFASVVLTSDNIFLRGTVADQNGNFSISQVLIKKGFSHFCLLAVDFRRLGDSETCLTIPPAQASVDMKEIFLPPTLGLSRTQISESGDDEAIAFGYTMPGAIVTLDLNGKKLVTTADSTGYYEFHLRNLKAGTYTLFAQANYKSKDSLAPSRKLTLISLSWWERLIAFIKDLLAKIYKFFTSIALGPLWFGLPLIILIITLILKIWPEKFTFIYQSKIMIFFTELFRRKKKRLHHFWFVGY